MEAFTIHRGVCAPLLRPNIDTDAIIPSREMKRVSKEGLGEGLFAAWRYTLPGGREPNPDFILNQAPFTGASILLGGPNFGCGSSREHAVWALSEFGVRSILAPGFGSIFRNNCVANGIVPVVMDEAVIARIADWVLSDPDKNQPTVDLEQCRVRFGDQEIQFDIDPASRRQLITGQDSIDLTLEDADLIDRFEHGDRQQRPWVYLD